MHDGLILLFYQYPCEYVKQNYTEQLRKGCNNFILMNTTKSGNQSAGWCFQNNETVQCQVNNPMIDINIQMWKPKLH